MDFEWIMFVKSFTSHPALQWFWPNVWCWFLHVAWSLLCWRVLQWLLLMAQLCVEVEWDRAHRTQSPQNLQRWALPSHIHIKKQTLHWFQYKVELNFVLKLDCGPNFQAFPACHRLISLISQFMLSNQLLCLTLSCIKDDGLYPKSPLNPHSLN